MVEESIYLLPAKPKAGEPSCRIGYEVYLSGGRYWFDILDFDVEDGDLPIHIEDGSRGFKRSETACRHAKAAVKKLVEKIKNGSKIDWR